MAYDKARRAFRTESPFDKPPQDAWRYSGGKGLPAFSNKLGKALLTAKQAKPVEYEMPPKVERSFKV